MSKPHIHYSQTENRYWIETPGGGTQWFDGPLEAEDAAAAVDRQKAALAERARIVAWLRAGGADQIVETHKAYLRDLADVIEAGEHLS